MRSWLVGLLLLLGAMCCAQNVVPGPVRLKPGDVLQIVVTAPDSPYGGEVAVLTDGAIYGLGFNRLVVNGKSIPEVQALVRRSLHNLVKEEFVFVTLKKQRDDVLYIIGPDAPGPVPYFTPISVRQAIGSVGPRGVASDPSSSPMNNPDTFQVDLIRDGKRIFRVILSKILRGTDPSANVMLRANDILAVIPEEVVHIWITGDVRKAGQFQLPAGSSIYEALATAGGPSSGISTDVRLFLRRGPDVTEMPLQEELSGNSAQLENGDVLTVEIPVVTHVTLLGDVTRPGDLDVKTGSTVYQAVVQAGGPTPSGTLTSVRVFRKGEVLDFDLSAPLAGGKPNPAKIEPGDLIFVDRNETYIFIFGEVNHAGKFALEDRRTYRLADVLSLAGGLGPRGTLRRVYIMRPVPNGKAIVTSYNLDEFLKDGKLAANPLIQSGDAILFGQPRGLTIGAAGEILSSLILIQAASGGRVP